MKCWAVNPYGSAAPCKCAQHAFERQYISNNPILKHDSIEDIVHGALDAESLAHMDPERLELLYIFARVQADTLLYEREQTNKTGV